MTTLYDHIYRLNVYLNEALPKARAEDAKGRLHLDRYATDCGLMGCVGYHYADAMGELDELKADFNETLDESIAVWILSHRATTFRLTCAFSDSYNSLNAREANVRARLAEYESELELRND